MSRNRYVYVISQGERGEGSFPSIATETLAQAKRRVFDLFDIGHLTKAEAGSWMARIDPTNATDEIWIHRVLLVGAS